MWEDEIQDWRNKGRPAKTGSEAGSECMNLLDCPFCGDKDIYMHKDFRNGEDIIRTSHTGCEAEVMFYGNNAETRQAVIDTWNKRAI